MKFNNPVVKGYADPDIYYENGKYYLYATSYHVRQGYEVLTSTDLQNWEKIGMAMESAWGAPNKYWAPDVKRIDLDGKPRYVMAATVDEHLGIAVAERPEGLFIPQEASLFDSTIDGHLFEDEDGSLYLYYVSWRRDHRYGLYGCKLDRSTLVPDLASEVLILVAEAEYECHHTPVVEAPYMLKKDGRYYLTYSGCHYESPLYCVAAAVSDSPLGKYERCDFNPVLVGNDEVHGCGHHCIVHAPDGEMYLVYHTHASPGKIHPRQLAVSRLWWEGDRLCAKVE